VGHLRKHRRLVAIAEVRRARTLLGSAHDVDG